MADVPMTGNVELKRQMATRLQAVEELLRNPRSAHVQAYKVNFDAQARCGVFRFGPGEYLLVARDGLTTEVRLFMVSDDTNPQPEADVLARVGSRLHNVVKILDQLQIPCNTDKGIRPRKLKPKLQRSGHASIKGVDFFVDVEVENPWREVFLQNVTEKGVLILVLGVLGAAVIKGALQIEILGAAIVLATELILVVCSLAITAFFQARRRAGSIVLRLRP